MRAIVTGGAGFIGSHLIEALLARGDRVVCIEREGATRGWLDGADFEWSPIGLADPKQLIRAFRDADVVFHLAGLTEARSSQDFYQVNTEGTAHVFEAAAAQAKPPHVILLSSLAAIGPCRNGERLTAHTVPCPLSHYGLSKLLAESIVHAYADRVPATVVRLSAVYGPRERAVLKMFRLVRRGLALTIGAWEHEVCLIFVKDVVATLLAAGAADSVIGRTYCLAHPEPTSWANFVYEVGRVVGRRPCLISVPTAIARWIARAVEICAAVRRTAAILNRERVRELSQKRWVCDPSDIFADTGYRPAYSLARGVRETAAWYEEVGWL
jgi:nucleoside-diphosphate-sugar epimerase